MLDDALKAAVKTKAEYNWAELKSTQLLDSFKQPSYAKEKAAYQDDLKDKLVALRAAKDKKQFFDRFLTKEVADIRAAFKADMQQLQSDATAFTKALTTPVAELTKCVKEILAVVKTREALSSKKM